MCSTTKAYMIAYQRLMHIIRNKHNDSRLVIIAGILAFIEIVAYYDNVPPEREYENS